MLSIATAPVDARQRSVAIAVTFTLAVVCGGLLPFAARPLPAAPAALPFLLGVALTANFITAYVLFSQFLSNRLLGTAFLAGAYLAAGVGLCAYLLSFPGLFGSGAPAQVSIWLWGAWHVEFPLLVIVALVLERMRHHARNVHAARRWIAALVLGAALLALVPAAFAFRWSAHLPQLIEGTSYAGSSTVVSGEFVAAINVVALGLAIAWTRGRTVLHTWLIVALVAAVLDVEISLAATARFTVGWYLARGLVVCSATVVLFAYLQQMHVLFTKLSDLSMVDGLTALPNRRYFEMRIDGAIRNARRAKRPLAVLLADVDAFKQFNDTYGHLAGDEALKAVAASLRICALRPGDVIARWGGEEFAAVLQETDYEGAFLVAERMRTSIVSLGIPHRRTPVAGNVITISIGVTLLGAADDRVETLMERVDTALYVAKSSGRNTSVFELPPPGDALPGDAPVLLEGRLSFGP